MTRLPLFLCGFVAVTLLTTPLVAQDSTAPVSRFGLILERDAPFKLVSPANTL